MILFNHLSDFSCSVLFCNYVKVTCLFFFPFRAPFIPSSSSTFHVFVARQTLKVYAVNHIP
jgi:hypothetical protein